jgi:hypothetical protein
MRKLFKLRQHNAVLENKYYNNRQFTDSELPAEYVLKHVGFEIPRVDMAYVLYDCIVEAVLWAFYPDDKRNINQKLKEAIKNGKKTKKKPDPFEDLPDPHTWMIPFYFSIFWAIVLILYVNYFLEPRECAFIPGAILLYLSHPFLFHYAVQFYRFLRHKVMKK